LPKTTRYLLYFIVAFFVLLTVLKSFYFSGKNGGSDLRIRVVASRLLGTDQSPYFHKWSPAEGEYLLDPNDHASRLVNGNVVTPAVLYLIYPVSWQSYPTVRILWTVIQFILVLLSLFLLLKNRKGPLSSIPAFIIVPGLICTDIWLLNIDRGQIYIFYTFLFALIYRLYTSHWKHSMLLSGFVGGLFILFRPFAAVLGLVFLLKGKKKWILGCMAGFITGCSLFVLPQPSLWKDYFKAMDEYSNEYTDKSRLIPDKSEYEQPITIEGMSNLRQAQEFNISGLDPVYGYLKKIGITVSKNQSYIFYVSIVMLLSFAFFRSQKGNSDPMALFLFAFLLYILAELFVTVPRGRYNLIQWLFPLTLIFLKTRFHQPLFILLIIGLLLLHNFPFIVPDQALMAELVFVSITIYYSLFLKANSSLQHNDN
jgi:hypothetical protein